MGIIGSCISLTNSIFKYLDYDLTSGGTANISVTGKIVCIFTTNKSGTVPILFPGIGYVDTSEYGWVDETALSFTYRWDNYANTVKYSINSDLKSGTINTLNFRGEAIYRVLYLA